MRRVIIVIVIVAETPPAAVVRRRGARVVSVNIQKRRKDLVKVWNEQNYILSSAT